jgi:hypothetical protein
VGKTRLALEAAEQVAPRFGDGVAWSPAVHPFDCRPSRCTRSRRWRPQRRPNCSCNAPPRPVRSRPGPALTLYQADGVIRSSTPRIGPDGRLFRLDGFVFDKVTPIFETENTGKPRRLRPYAQYGDPCTITFRENTFLVTRKPTAGEIIASEYDKRSRKIMRP